MTAITSAAGITWDLSDLYQGYDDPAIMRDMNRAAAEAEAFALDYRGTMNVPGGPPPEHLYSALQRLEALYDLMARPLVYAGLLFAADTSQHQHRNLQQQVEQRSVTIKNRLIFFHLELLALSEEDVQRLIEYPTLALYRHYIQASRRYIPHTLTEPEEQIINEKDLTGVQAWQTFFTELMASLRFPMERDGEQQELPLESMLALMRRSDRPLREQAFHTLYRVLGSQSQPLTYIYNTLLQDHITMNRLRAYSDPMQARNLSNEIDSAAVATMLEVVEQNHDIAHSYFALKARLLGLPRLQIYDQYAPIGSMTASKTFAEAQDIILESLGTFDRRFRDIAASFFEKGWIDAEVRPGKTGGAFCNGYPPSNHPYVLCNYTDDMRDVMTLAHELGHAIHFWLAGKQTLFNYSPSLPLAEMASVFGEILVFEHLLNQEHDQQARLALVCSKIEDIFATVFRQNVMTRFEQTAFAGRRQGRLTTEQFGAYWLEANAHYYGDAVEMTPGYELGWSYIPHFIHTPFYCYSYVFGELLVLALYSMYREHGQAFVPRYMALLEAGGSRSPEDLLTDMGLDMRDPAFWQRGFDELRRMVDRAHGLAGQ